MRFTGCLQLGQQKSLVVSHWSMQGWWNLCQSRETSGFKRGREGVCAGEWICVGVSVPVAQVIGCVGVLCVGVSCAGDNWHDGQGR